MFCFIAADSGSGSLSACQRAGAGTRPIPEPECLSYLTTATTTTRSWPPNTITTIRITARPGLSGMVRCRTGKWGGVVFRLWTKVKPSRGLNRRQNMWGPENCSTVVLFVPSIQSSPSISNTALLSSFKWWKSLYGRSNYKIKKSNFDVESWKPLAKNFSTKITFFFTSALIIFSFMKSYLFIYIYIHTIFFNFPFEQT